MSDSGDLLIRVLPDRTAWAADVLQLEEVLRFATGAAHRQHDGAFAVPGLAFETAADAVALTADPLPAAPASGSPRLRALAAHQVDALLDAVHRAVAGDDAEDLLDTLGLLLAGGVRTPGSPPRASPRGLDRVLAVLAQITTWHTIGVTT